MASFVSIKVTKSGFTRGFRAGEGFIYRTREVFYERNINENSAADNGIREGGNGVFRNVKRVAIPKRGREDLMEMKEYLDRSISYEEYIKLIDDLLLEGKTTGPKQSEAMYGYGKLNRQRMHRLEKTVEINESLKAKVKAVTAKWTWLIITEGWCGDAAQNIPVIEKIAAENPNVETRYVLRDENLELMDRYLTNNARSIPKLIALDSETLEEIGTWGPRPQAAMDYFLEMRAAAVENALIKENIQRWYNADKSQAVQQEFETLIGLWSAISHPARSAIRGLSGTFGGLF